MLYCTVSACLLAVCVCVFRYYYYCCHEYVCAQVDHFQLVYNAMRRNPPLLHFNKGKVRGFYFLSLGSADV